MTRPGTGVDFFIIEANEYIDRLDLLLAPAGSAGPDADALARQARALRGSATMYRQSAFARLAAAIERTAVGIREGSLRWDAALRGALVASIDDLRTLVRSVRSWGPAEEQRAATRSQELERIAPPRFTPVSPTPTNTGTAFLAATAARLAEALERVIAAPADRPRLEAALEQVRAARGIASLRDAAPLPEVCDAVERAVDVLDAGEGTTTARQLSLLGAAAAVLRHSAADLAAGRAPSPAPAEVQRFASAASALAEPPSPESTVVPIADLFYPDGHGVVSAAAQPPSTPRARLRMELVSHAEHLRRLIAEGRAASDPIALGRLTRDVRIELHALAASARSFGEERLAAAFSQQQQAITSVDSATLVRLEQLANALSGADEQLTSLAERVEKIGSAAEPAKPPTLPPAFREEQPPAPPRSPTPTGKALFALLETGIETLGRLRDRPLTPPVALPSEEVVPIESLFYRGSSALERARELRDQVHAGGGMPTRDILDELVDLVELAASE